MGRYAPELTDEQWAEIGPLLPVLKPGKQGGRSWVENRPVFEGILWILRTGSPWNRLPKEYPSPATCWRRLKKWEEEGVWENAWHEYLKRLDDKGVLSWDECFIDATFMPAKKGVSRLARLARERERSSWWFQTVAVYRLESTLRARRLARRLSRNDASTLFGSLDRDPAALARILRDL